MKTIVLAGLAVAASGLATLTPAQAQGGCGPYAHRGWDGYCHPGGFARPYGFRPYGYGYGWHRPWGYGYGWHRPWGYYHRWG